LFEHWNFSNTRLAKRQTVLSVNHPVAKSTNLPASLELSRRLLQRLFLPLAVILFSVNVQLGVMLRQAQSEVTRLKEMRHVPIGQPLPPLVGSRLTGEPVSLRPGASGMKPALLFILSPSCPACARAWPLWNDLRRQTRGNIDHIFLDVSGSMDMGYATEHGITDSVITKLDGATVLGFSLLSTPELIFVGIDGTARKVWTGLLSEQVVAEVIQMLGQEQNRTSAEIPR
jgi:hypothetical protein